MAIKRPDTPLAATVSDSTRTNKKSPAEQRALKQASQVKMREEIKRKKDSVFAAGAPKREAAQAKKEANAKKLDSIFKSGAEKRGLTPEQYSRQLKNQKRKPDAKSYETCGPNSNQKGAPCGVSKKAAKKG